MGKLERSKRRSEMFGMLLRIPPPPPPIDRTPKSVAYYELECRRWERDMASNLKQEKIAGLMFCFLYAVCVPMAIGLLVMFLVR